MYSSCLVKVINNMWWNILYTCICWLYLRSHISRWMFRRRIYRYFHSWSWYKHLAKGPHCRVICVLVLWMMNRRRGSCSSCINEMGNETPKTTDHLTCSPALFLSDTWVWLGNHQKQCNFGNHGLSSHSEETNEVRFLEFLVCWKKLVN
jgi:hypothetical protein